MYSIYTSKWMTIWSVLQFFLHRYNPVRKIMLGSAERIMNKTKNGDISKRTLVYELSDVYISFWSVREILFFYKIHMPAIMLCDFVCINSVLASRILANISPDNSLILSYTTPYLNQCRLIARKVSWHSHSETNVPVSIFAMNSVA